MSRHPHILNASSSLLGICFVIITGLKLTGANPQSWADEITWIASLLFLASIVVSYLGVRNEGRFEWMAVWAERAFLAGVGSLTVAVFVGAVSIQVEGQPRTSAQATSTQASPTIAPASTSVR